jgi:hypothetical protein
MAPLGAWSRGRILSSALKILTELLFSFFLVFKFLLSCRVRFYDSVVFE